MAKSIGIIDKGYRGNIMAKVDNIKTEPFTIKKGTRLFQIAYQLCYQLISVLLINYPKLLAVKVDSEVMANKLIYIIFFTSLN